jgi:hypothetical protein
MVALVLAGALALSAAPHSEANPVFRQLVEQGVTPSGEAFTPLPTPTMPDGLDVAGQRKVLESVGRPHSYDQFMRKSVVAPHVLRMHEVAGPDPKAPLQAVDIFFVAYGEMDALTNKNFLKNAFQEDKQEEAEGLAMTPEQLAERSIVIPPESQDHEGYGQTTMRLLNQVELSVVGRSYWSRTDDSIVTAAMVDPRFTDDPQWANVWRPLTRTPGGKLERGAPQPYRGAGLYMKITRLARPAGALFVEAHIVYAEPHSWFDGANQLGAKLPAVTQQKVREMRQEMLRAAQPK